MVYIRLIDTEIIKNSIKDKLLNKFCNLKKDEFEGKKLIEIKDLKTRTLKKLDKYFKSNCISRVCISNNLLKNNTFLEFLKTENIKYFDGRWLFRHLIINVIEYICLLKKEKLEYQELSILSNSLDWELLYSIKNLAINTRVLNIVTNYENKFRKIEKELYEEKGIILNISNNYKKSLSKSDIILNMDFSEEELNKYSFPKKTCIVNFTGQIKVCSKAFEGINANFYELNMPRKYLDKLLFFKDFNTSILYESFIFKNTMPQNILKEINEDDANIAFLEGINGKIRKTEYLKLSKKIAN